MLQNARKEDWMTAKSARFTAANKELATNLQLLQHTATGGATLPLPCSTTIPTKNKSATIDKMLAAAKRLKLVSTTSAPGVSYQGGNNPHDTNMDARLTHPHPIDHGWEPTIGAPAHTGTSTHAQEISYMPRKGSCPCPKDMESNSAPHS